MFVIWLRFGANRGAAAEHLPGHEQWLRSGFAEGVFALSGSLASGDGGAVIAHGLSRAELDELVGRDPFVAEGVVVPEITEIAPALSDERLGFLVA